jgi:hypothetical protein
MIDEKYPTEIDEAYHEGFQKGKLEQKKEELEFLSNLFRETNKELYMQSDSIFLIKDKMKQLQKEIGDESK